MVRYQSRREISIGKSKEVLINSNLLFWNFVSSNWHKFLHFTANRNGSLRYILSMLVFGVLLFWLVSSMFHFDLLLDIFRTIGRYLASLPIFITRRKKELSKIEVAVKYAGSFARILRTILVGTPNPGMFSVNAVRFHANFSVTFRFYPTGRYWGGVCTRLGSILEKILVLVKHLWKNEKKLFLVFNIIISKNISLSYIEIIRYVFIKLTSCFRWNWENSLILSLFVYELLQFPSNCYNSSMEILCNLNMARFHSHRRW